MATGTAEISLKDVVAELRRHLDSQRVIYTRFVRTGRMPREVAMRRIDLVSAAIERLEASATAATEGGAAEAGQGDLFEGVG